MKEMIAVMLIFLALATGIFAIKTTDDSDGINSAAKTTVAYKAMTGHADHIGL